MFALAGLYGFYQANQNKPKRSTGIERWSQWWLMVGAATAAFAEGVFSTYYHWDPNDETLIGDRLFIGVALACVAGQLLADRTSDRVGVTFGLVFSVFGVASVLYWVRFDDLRPYAFAQLAPALAALYALVVYQSPYTLAGVEALSLVLLAAGKVTESADKIVWALLAHVVSGHNLKHILIGLAAGVLFYSNTHRRRIQGKTGGASALAMRVGLTALLIPTAYIVKQVLSSVK
jgi:hypothetical protein